MAFKSFVINNDEESPPDYPQWTIDLVKTVDTDFKLNSVGASPCGTLLHHADSKGWFLHPSDALLLGSYITQEDVCKYQGMGPKMLSPEYPLNLAILDRREDRRILNIHQIMDHDFVINSGNNDTSKFSIMYLDEKPLIHQARLFRHVDILLIVKGEGETNIAWMKPCSVVVEISPWGYFVPHYFQKLAKRSGILHYPWQVGFKETGTKELYRNRPECARTFRSMNALANHSQVNKECFGDQVCRSCALEVDGVVIDYEDVQHLINKGMADRERCIQSHPFLSGAFSLI